MPAGYKLSGGAPSGTPVARTNLVGAFIKSGHPFAARFSATDHHFQRCGIEPRGPQICSGGRLVPLLLPIREGTVAFGAAAPLPNLQTGLHSIVVLRPGGGQVRENADDDGQNDASDADAWCQLHVFI